MRKAILQRIIGPLTVICVRFEDANRYTIHLFLLEGSREGFRILRKSVESGTDALKKACSGRLVLILVSGYGVVTKSSENTMIVERVTSDPETFAWSFSDNDTDGDPATISFVRREQVEALLESLSGKGMSIADLRYASGTDTPEQEARRQAKRFYCNLSWRTLLHSSPEGRMVAKAAEHRLRLPVLGLMLLLLVVNTVVSGSLQEHRAYQQTVLAAREKKQDASQTRSEQRRAAVAEFSHRQPYRHALLLDRVASHVPPSVRLTSLAVQPMLKTLEDGHDPVYAYGFLTIRGRTEDAGSVSALMGGLKTEPLLCEAQLEGLEQNRESGVTEFEITVFL